MRTLQNLAQHVAVHGTSHDHHKGPVCKSSVGQTEVSQQKEARVNLGYGGCHWLQLSPFLKDYPVQDLDTRSLRCRTLRSVGGQCSWSVPSNRDIGILTSVLQNGAMLEARPFFSLS